MYNDLPQSSVAMGTICGLLATLPFAINPVLSRGQRLLATEVSDARSALSLLPQALANRTLLLTGDSVTRHVFHELLKLIAVPHEPRTTVVNPIGNLVSCHEWKSAFRLCLTEAGGDGGKPLKRLADGSLNRSECLRPQADIGWWGINPSDVFACLAEMQVINDDSIVISNFGLHHNDLRSLRRNVESFLAWRHASPTRPCIVWRETTPQHFASSDGTFKSGDGPWRTSDPLAPCCARLNYTEVAGQHQRFNEVSTPMMLRAGVPVAQVWAALAPHWDLHPPMNATGCFLRRINEDMRRVLSRPKPLPPGDNLDCVHWHHKASAWLGVTTITAALQACPAAFSRKLDLRPRLIQASVVWGNGTGIVADDAHRLPRLPTRRQADGADAHTRSRRKQRLLTLRVP